MADERLTFILESRDLSSGVTRKVRNEMSGLSGAMSKLRSQFTLGTVAGNLLTTGISAVGSAITESIGEAVEFQTKMLNVNSITKASAGEFANMSQQVIDLSKTLPQSASTLAGGLYDIASSGFKGADGMEVLEAAARAASAGLTTTEVSASGLTAVLNAYHLSADEASRISDIMFQTVNLGVVTFEELSSEIGKTTALSSPLGVSFEEVSAALSLMTRNGIDAANATTQINAIMTNLLKPSTQAVKLAKELGLGWDSQALKAKGLSGVLADLIKKTGGNHEQMAVLLGDQRAIRGALVLAANGGKQFNAEIGKMEDAAGATSSALSEQEKGLAFQVAIFGNNLQALVTEGLTAVLPLLTEFVDLARTLLPFVTELAQVVVPLLAVALGTKLVLALQATVVNAGFAEAALLAIRSAALLGVPALFAFREELTKAVGADVWGSVWATRDAANAEASAKAQSAAAIASLEDGLRAGNGIVEKARETWARSMAAGGPVLHKAANIGLRDPIIGVLHLTQAEVKAIGAQTPSDIAAAIISGKVDINAIRQRMREIIKNPVSDAKTEAENAALLISPAVARGLASNSTQVKAQMLAEVVEPTLASLRTLNPRVFQEGQKLPPVLAKAINQKGPEVVAAMRDLIGRQNAPLSDLARIAHEWGLAGTEALIRGMLQKQAAAAEAARKLARNTAAKLELNAYWIGLQVGESWADGLRAAGPAVGKAADILREIAGGALSFSGSPPFTHSRWLGEMVGKTWAEGVNSGSAKVEMPALMPTMTYAGSGGTGTRGSQATYNINLPQTVVPYSPAQLQDAARILIPAIMREQQRQGF